MEQAKGMEGCLLYLKAYPRVLKIDTTILVVLVFGFFRDFGFLVFWEGGGIRDAICK